MTDIIDNREELLVEHVCRILRQTESVKFAVGYFFVSGLEEIANHLDKIGKIRLLIGNQSNQETIDALMQKEMDPARVQSSLARLQNPKEKQRIAEETGQGIRDAISVPPLTDESELLLRQIRSWIAEDKLEVRVYTKEKLHAKAYLFAYPEQTYENGIGIVGSSNLTLSGLRNNSELNVLVHGNDNFKQLNGWFDRLWEEAEAFTEGLLREIDESWAGQLNTPWEIYLKTLLKLVEDRLEHSDRHVLHWDGKLPPLTQFQKVAVDQGLKILRDHEGVFISDVVGLGKTFIGVGLLKNLARAGHKNQVIVCPNSLEENWQEITREFGLFVDIVPMSQLSTKDSPLGSKWVQNADVVLIDESHNFRNPDSQRYQAMESFLRGKKVILLTATPRNNSAWDLYYQLRLFQDDVTPTLDIGAHDNLKKYFKRIGDCEKNSRDPDNTEAVREASAREARQMIEHLLQQVLIRRTRKHIQKHYADNLIKGKPIEFPARALNRLDYSIDDTYNNLYNDIRHRIAGLHYARYSIGLYLQDDFVDRDPWSRLARAGRSLRGLMRILLHKRFESSVAAFRNTLQSMIRMHELFLEAIRAGVVVSDARLLERLEDEDGNFDPSFLDEESGTTYPVTNFKIDLLESDLQDDMRNLNEILGMVKGIGPPQDAKLQKLLSAMTAKPLSDEKVIIFTQYADTARYLHEQLQQSVRPISVIDSKTKNKMGVLRRFSPRSNNYEPKPDEAEIRVVIATDVLSEGLNLQDASCVVNYDLHWNPVRLIQRVGRVDRIGSTNQTIHIYNFFPETALDRGLGLRDRLTRRIQEIHDTIGEDERILDERERLNETDMYSIYSNDAAVTDDDSEGFTINEAEMLIRDLRDTRPDMYERIMRLPDGIRSGLRADVRGTFVFCGAGRRHKRMFLLDEAGRSITSDPVEIVPLLRCDEKTPATKLPENHNARVEEARQMFVEHVQKVYQSLNRPALETEQQYVLDKLSALRSDLLTPEDRRTFIDILSSCIAQQLPSYVLLEIRRFKREKRVGEDLLDAVDTLVRHFELERRLRERQALLAYPVPKVFCSESLVKD